MTKLLSDQEYDDRKDEAFDILDAHFCDLEICYDSTVYQSAIEYLVELMDIEIQDAQDYITDWVDITYGSYD